MILLMLLFVVILFLIFINKQTMKDIKELSTDDTYDKQTASLPSNEIICKEIQHFLGNECEIKLDDEAKSSAYIFFQNKIILSNTEDSKKNYTRILFIAHECIHSIQSRMTHIINFVLANIRNIYDIILLVLLMIGRGSLELIMVSFLISFLSFYYRMILEVDAIYRSVIVSRKYLKENNLEFVADRYEEIIPKTISGLYFTYIVPILFKLLIFVSLNLF